MGAIREWFEEELKLTTLIRVLPILVLLQTILTMTGLGIALLFFTAESLSANGNMLKELTADLSLGKLLMVGAVIAPILEEFIFRFVPFCTIFGLLWSLKIDRTEVVMPVVFGSILFTAIGFGYMHGVGNILVQGIGGVFLAIVYLRCSSFGRSMRSHFRGWIGSSLVHVSFNTVMLLSIRLGPQ
jgi:membrane protease YdiL (CAAX protease family)